jgi:undecaprenyl pyrophosphate synthase
VKDPEQIAKEKKSSLLSFYTCVEENIKRRHKNNKEKCMNLITKNL